MYRRFSKRILDFAGALFLLALLVPFIFLICLLLLFYNKGQIFFTQRRPGKDEKPFLLYKFQTMATIGTGYCSESERITKFGNILRKTSIDEIPQLINVLKGEMSFIGPRPLLMEYLPLYSDVQRKRHTLLPGITGWAQVNGRNSISWEEKFSLDLYYTEQLSFSLDLKIISLSILRILAREDIYTKNGAVVEKFKGNK